MKRQAVPGHGGDGEVVGHAFAERRASMGIVESLIRVSVDIEDTQDLLDDFATALNV